MQVSFFTSLARRTKTRLSVCAAAAGRKRTLFPPTQKLSMTSVTWCSVGISHMLASSSKQGLSITLAASGCNIHFGLLLPSFTTTGLFNTLLQIAKGSATRVTSNSLWNLRRCPVNFRPCKWTCTGCPVASEMDNRCKRNFVAAGSPSHNNTAAMKCLAKHDSSRPPKLDPRCTYLYGQAAKG